MARKSKNILLGLVVLTSMAALSCSGGAYYAYRVPPPPPPPVAGFIGVAPGVGFVWIDGFYDLRGSSWFWVPGHWARRPHPYARWEPSRWERHGDHYRFNEGRWR